jgi:hypothetical protein
MPALRCTHAPADEVEPNLAATFSSHGRLHPQLDEHPTSGDEVMSISTKGWYPRSLWYKCGRFSTRGHKAPLTVNGMFAGSDRYQK